MNKEQLNQFEAIFNPQSIAIVGASAGVKVGGIALRNFINAGYRGRIFPVNNREKEILGLKSYPSVREIPEPVDFVISMVPSAAVLGLIDDCAAKGVKAVQLFTAGFSETGREEAKQLEKELVARARRAGIRLIGPNCGGISCPARLIPLASTGIIGEPGNTALLVQSGGNAEMLAEIGVSRGIRFSKIISFGNAADLNAIDFLEYLAQDLETRIIGVYLEGIGDGHRLYQLVADISRSKPVVFLKGGRTEVGKGMAVSHTASLSGSTAVWSTAMKQAGAIEVDTMEEMADTLLAFQCLPPVNSNRIVVISQLGGGGGGAAVLAADVCVRLGLELPAFTGRIEDELKALVDAVGSSVHNPIDLNGSDRNRPAVIAGILEVLAGYPDIDLIMQYERPAFLLSMMLPEAQLQAINDVLVDYHRSHTKPLVVVSPPGSQYEAERIAVEKRLSGAGVPVYPSFKRAARAIANIIRYWQFRGRA